MNIGGLFLGLLIGSGAIYLSRDKSGTPECQAWNEKADQLENQRIAMLNMYSEKSGSIFAPLDFKIEHHIPAFSSEGEEYQQYSAYLKDSVALMQADRAHAEMQPSGCPRKVTL